MSILVVGSVALDTIQTPFGQVQEALGGSATYFALAASLYTKVNLVGVVGQDFPAPHAALLRSRGVDLAGLEVAEGETFRWVGRYDFGLNTATTLDTQLGVFAAFQPQLPEAYCTTPFVFLANIDPSLQQSVLQQMQRPQLTVLDSMNYWIEGKRPQLAETMALVDIVMMNEAELRQFAGTYSIVRAAREVLALGPRALAVKRGEYGAVLFADSGYFVAPAYPLEEVRDPTGAGDSFAGGFLGYLAQVGEVTPRTIRQALIHGSVVASFTVEDFGVARLKGLTQADVQTRYQELRQFTHFE